MGLIAARVLVLVLEPHGDLVPARLYEIRLGLNDRGGYERQRRFGAEPRVGPRNEDLPWAMA